jgi:hypothetical protein
VVEAVAVAENLAEEAAEAVEKRVEDYEGAFVGP